MKPPLINQGVNPGLVLQPLGPSLGPSPNSQEERSQRKPRRRHKKSRGPAPAAPATEKATQPAIWTGLVRKILVAICHPSGSQSRHNNSNQLAAALLVTTSALRFRRALFRSADRWCYKIFLPDPAVLRAFRFVASPAVSASAGACL